MRFVSLANTVQYDIHGNVLQQAICLADVDANKSNELVVGTFQGELLIFKGARKTFWKKASGLGFIVAVTVGIFQERAIIFVANAEGMLYLFALKSTLERRRHASADQHASEHSYNHLPILPASPEEELKVSYSQQLICNPKVILVEEYDGEKQLIIGYYDQTLRIFSCTIHEESDARLSVRFILKLAFNVAGQIHTITSNRLNKNAYELVISQSGGNLIRFNPNEMVSTDQIPAIGRLLSTDISKHENAITEAISLENFFPNITQTDSNTVYATCTSDGSINIFSNNLEKQTRSIQLNNVLFGLQKGDFMNDGTNQLAVSSWDGDTFIIDHRFDIIRFKLDEKVRCFTAGLYAVESMNTYCFIYVTFNDKIVIVHNLELSSMKINNLATMIMMRENKLKETLSHLSSDQMKQQIVELLHTPY
ncbi:unnamed protein product [Didymodactylos carnosus]|uniref:Uncharacterized protein n=1 Tax=Didymodactylos carnosus TaxID=1234261 RepID=A0A813YHB5_9BILA|nr:unnamed protein product [Didymodactylos carnosus]CAF3669869.1 unnamed protein product [Didymodactylos carnosus]